MIVPAFNSNSRLMMFAPHPDDEALACSIFLQHADRTGAAIRVVYATDGEDNPWPQRVVECKWRLNGTDRRHWGNARELEAERHVTSSAFSEDHDIEEPRAGKKPSGAA